MFTAKCASRRPALVLNMPEVRIGVWPFIFGRSMLTRRVSAVVSNIERAIWSEKICNIVQGTNRTVVKRSPIFTRGNLEACLVFRWNTASRSRGFSPGTTQVLWKVACNTSTTKIWSRRCVLGFHTDKQRSRFLLTFPFAVEWWFNNSCRRKEPKAPSTKKESLSE